MAWVPKGSIQTQDEDDVCTEGAMQLKKNRRSKRRSSNIRFAPNHQNYWSVHHPFDSQMSYTPVYWNSSMNMFGYPSCSYFDPWTPCGSLHQGGLSPNCYAYWLISKAEIFSSWRWFLFWILCLSTLFPLYIFLWMNLQWTIICIILGNTYGRWMSLIIVLKF